MLGPAQPRRDIFNSLPAPRVSRPREREGISSQDKEEKKKKILFQQAVDLKALAQERASPAALP